MGQRTHVIVLDTARLRLRRFVPGDLDTLGLERMICLIDPANRASTRVALRIGMRLERELDGMDGDGMPTNLFARSSSERGNARGDRPGA